jgi:cysteinyl-tRNA synthetase
MARVPHDAAAQRHTLLLIRAMTAALAVWLEGRQVSSAAAAGAPAESVEPYIDQLVALRGQLRAAKQWALADVVRNSLTERGVVIEDGAAGTTWRRAA